MKKNYLQDPVEIQSRKNLFARAKLFGIEHEIKTLYAKYDGMLSRCTDEKEFQAIKIMAIAEIHRAMSATDALVVDGVEIIPAKYEGEVVPAPVKRITKIE